MTCRPLASFLALSLSLFVPSSVGSPLPGERAALPPGVSVTPANGTTAEKAPNTGGHSVVFTVKNTGTEMSLFTITRACSTNLSCSNPSITEVDLMGGQSVNVTVWFSTLGPGLGFVTLTASGSGGEWGQGRWNVPVGHDVTVTPDGQSSTAKSIHTGGHTETFTVKNIGGASHTYTLTCGGPNVTCNSLSQTSVTLAGGAQTPITANYTVGNAGTSEIRVWASGTGVVDSGSYTMTVSAAAGAPVIDATPYNYASQDYARCASACFAAFYAQSTVPYVSLDAPRSITLVYNGDRVAPKPFVHVNVKPDIGYGQTPTEYRMEVRVDGVQRTFLNGEQTLRFANQDTASRRVGGQFDAGAFGTGAYALDILVSAVYTSGVITNTWKSKLIVVNDTASAIASGWTLAGIQRLYSFVDGSVLITKGGGSGAYFAKFGPNFVTPGGDVSKLRSGTPSGGPGWTRGYPDSTKVVFNSAGRMIEIRDRLNNITTVVHDASNRVLEIKDPINLTITLAYDASGLSSIQDAGGRVTTVTVNGSRLLTAFRDPDNVSTTFGYDGSQRLSTITNRRGHTTTLSYDPNSGKLTTITAPPVVLFDGSVTSPVTSLVAWHHAGVPYSSTASPFTPPFPDSVRASVTNPRGFATTYAVDRFGAPTRVEAPLGQTTVFTRDSNSNILRVAAPSGHVVRHTWSGPDPTQTWDSTVGRTINYAYEPTYHQVSSVTGDVDSLFNYWSGGKLDSTRVANRAATKFTYDSRGRTLSATDPGGHTTNFYYGATTWQNLDSVKTGSRKVTFKYGTHGRVDTIIDPSSYRTSFQYDVLNRTLRTTGPLGDTTRYDYDSLYIRAVIDAKGQRYRYVRNALGWIESDTNPAGLGRRYSYDQNGNLKSVVNRRPGSTVSLTYDALDRVLTRTAGGETTSYAYRTDTLERFSAVSNSESTDTVRFDRAGRPDYQIATLGGTRYELRSTYNNRDLRTSLILTPSSPWADTISFIYNVNMLLDTLIDLGGGRTRIRYNGDLLPDQVVLPNGLTVTRTFPSTHTAAEVTYSNASVNSAIGVRYGYDSRGLVGDRIKATGDSGREFFYDAAGELTKYRNYTVQASDCEWFYDPHNGYQQYCFSTTRTYTDSVTFSYDSVGNRTDLGAVVAAGNRLVKVNGDSLVYDEDGNLIRRLRGGADIQRLYWNALGQLVAVWTSGADSVNFGYDGSGRRVRKWTGSGSTVRFIWDGDDLFAETDGAHARIAEYTYYPGVDQPHSLRGRGRADSVFYFAQDFPGNVVGLISSSVSLVNKYRYKPFGEPEIASEGAPNRLRFAGREFDSETGLYYVRARYYDPKLGRFISEDPIGLDGGINAYAYVNNSPSNFTDPSGLWACLVEIEWWLYPDGSIEGVITNILYCWNDTRPGRGGGRGGRQAPGRDRREGVCRAQTVAGPIEVDASIANNAVAFVNFAVSMGAEFSLTSSFRTTDHQAILYYGRKAGVFDYDLVAPPRSSPHEAGFALDILFDPVDTGTRTALLIAAAMTGFEWMGAKDPVHWDWGRGYGPYRSKTEAIRRNQELAATPIILGGQGIPSCQ